MKIVLKNSLTTLIVAMLTTCFGTDGYAQRHTRVVNGSNASEGAWPWMVALVAAGNSDSTEAHFCGGTLIGPQFILTAAHCVNERNPVDTQVLIGERVLSFGPGNRQNILGFAVHPNFNPDTLENDLAIVKLAKPVSNPSIKLALQSEQGSYTPGTNAMVLGWGRRNPTLTILPTILQQGEVPIQSDQVCLDEIGRYFKPNSMMCAGTRSTSSTVIDGVDACFGDSGGPLVVSDGRGAWKQVGIVSWGFGCSGSVTRGVYSEIPANENFATSFPTIAPYSLDNPRIIKEPVIVGSTVVCQPGAYLGDPPTSFTYAWYREGVLISAATDAAYKVSDDDAGFKLLCSVKASNVGGTSSESYSDDLYVDYPVPQDLPTPTPTETGTTESDTEAPTAKFLSTSWEKNSCTIIVIVEDDSSGVEAVSLTGVVTYTTRCKGGKKCNRTKTTIVDASLVGKDVWSATVPVFSHKKQRLQLQCGTRDFAGNSNSAAAVASKKISDSRK